MPAGDFALDINGDLLFGPNGDTVGLTGIAATVADVLSRIQFFLGEWFMDVTGVGFPWLQDVLGQKQPDIAAIAGRLVTVILGCPDMIDAQVTNLDFNSDTRVLTIGWQGQSINGAIPYTELGMPVPGGT